MKRKKDVKIFLIAGILLTAFVTTGVLIYKKNDIKIATPTKYAVIPGEPVVVNPASQIETSDAVGKKKIYRLNLNVDNTVMLVGEIGSNSLRVAQEILHKSRPGYPVYLLINSPGGSVLDGVSIVDAVQGASGPVNTICLQLCASMAAVIFNYGTERYMSDRAVLMHHQAAGSMEGSFNQMRSRFSALEHYVAKLDYEIATRAGMNPEQFKKMLSDEIWMDAEDSVKNHFADKLAIISIEIPESNGFSQDKLSQTAALKEKVRINLK
jgi:ATP-dependent Clp endopeptidase proteolytic subunit ClpP